jgi:hypothetical protein
MKQIGSISRLAGVCAAIALLANLSLSAAEIGKAEITGVKGSVKVDGNSAKVGDSISPGQQIETGAASQLNLYLGNNGPTVVLFADTRLSFDELTSDKSGSEPVINTKINLKAGSVAGYVKKTSSQSSYVVQGPTTTAAIRGTEYQMMDNGVVAVWEGCVTVSYRGNNYEVCANQMFDPSVGAVVSNTYPRPPVPSNQARPTTIVVPVTPTRPNPQPSPTEPAQSGE